MPTETTETMRIIRSKNKEYLITFICFCSHISRIDALCKDDNYVTECFQHAGINLKGETYWVNYDDIYGNLGACGKAMIDFYLDNKKSLANITPVENKNKKTMNFDGETHMIEETMFEHGGEEYPIFEIVDKVEEAIVEAE